jgi:phosphocarrier protein
MKTFEYRINAELGIHARAAGMLVKAAKGFADAEITVSKGGRQVGATKLIALMGLGVKQGDVVTVSVNGGDEEAVSEAMKEFFAANL